MTTFWILIWIILSTIILGANIWSWVILYQQKQAWESLARKYKMVFRKNRFLAPPELEGKIDDFQINMFTAERKGMDIRTRRYMTVMEIVFPKPLVDGGALGTPEMYIFIESIGTVKPLNIDGVTFKEGVRLYSRNDDNVKAFMTPERVEHINHIFSTRNVDILFIFSDNISVLRIETADPMSDAVKLDKAIHRILNHTKAIQVTTPETSQPQN